MADKRGWWRLEIDVNPTESDMGHIIEMIKQGYVSGEVENDETENIKYK